MTHDKALKVARGFFGHGIATGCHLAAPCYQCDALASLIESQRAEAVEEARAGIERAARIEALEKCKTMRKKLYTEFGCEGKFALVLATPIWWIESELASLKEASNEATNT